MKSLFIALLVTVIFTACSNESGNKNTIGDSLDVDPTTAQPITTEPDTVGPNASDTTQPYQSQ